MTNIQRFHDFAQLFTRLVKQVGDDEARIFEEGKKLLADLTLYDDWLPEEFAQSDPDWYQQYLLYCDPWERFSVVSCVWDPGQGTPVYDLTIWGMIGVLRGSLACTRYTEEAGGYQWMAEYPQHLEPGQVFVASPSIGDVHKVSNALGDRTSVSVHVYGLNIAGAKRYVYDVQTGQRKKFTTSYSNPVIARITQSRLKVLLNRIKEL